MNPLAAVFLASTLEPILDLMAWCLLVETGGEQ